LRSSTSPAARAATTGQMPVGARDRAAVVHPQPARAFVGGDGRVGSQLDELERLVVRQPQLDALGLRTETRDDRAMRGAGVHARGAGRQVDLDAVAAGQLVAGVQHTVDEHVDAAPRAVGTPVHDARRVGDELDAGCRRDERHAHARRLCLHGEQLRIGEPPAHPRREAVRREPAPRGLQLGCAADEVVGERGGDHTWAPFVGQL
jgi:hypothetical protein